MDGTHGTDLGDGTLGIDGIDLGVGIPMLVWVGTLGIVLGAGILGTMEVGTLGMDVQIWVGAITFITVMYITATIGTTIIIQIGITAGITAETLPILYMAAAKVDHFLQLPKGATHLLDV